MKRGGARWRGRRPAAWTREELLADLEGAVREARECDACQDAGARRRTLLKAAMRVARRVLGQAHSQDAPEASVTEC